MTQSLDLRDARGRIATPGLYLMPDEEYHGDCCAGPSFSSSGAVTMMASCPQKYWFGSYMNRARPAEEGAHNRDIGSAFHIAILEPDTFSARVVEIVADDYRSKVAQTERAAIYAAGRVPLLSKQLEVVGDMAEALRAHPLAAPLFAVEGQREASLFACDRQTGVWLKARPDWRPTGARFLVDLKTVPNAAPREIERHAFAQGWHQQAPWYLAVDQMATGEQREDFYFVVQEREAPYLVSVHKVAGDAMAAGMTLNRAAIDLFAWCLERGEWPGYRDPMHPHVDRAFALSLPRYAAFQLQDRTDAGEFKAKPTERQLAAARAAQAPLEEIAP